jgi:hypothetical protein
MMDIFAMFGRYDLVKRLLLVVEPFVKIHPLARNTGTPPFLRVCVVRFFCLVDNVSPPWRAVRSYWDAVHRHEREAGL